MVIIAAAVLHNFGLDVGDVFKAKGIEFNDDDFAVEEAQEAGGNEVRRLIILNYFD